MLESHSKKGSSLIGNSKAVQRRGFTRSFIEASLSQLIHEEPLSSYWEA